MQLKAHGHVHKGLCPFHKEKTPSFTVDDTRGTYHCFGCSQHGDVIKFVMETERMSFPEAVKQLAGEAGLSLPKEDPHYAENIKRAQSLYEIMELACAYFQQQLAAPEGKIARDYLAGRRIKAASITKFRIGYAPEGRNNLRKYLQGKGVSDSQMLSVGLLAKSEKGDVYDKFRGRVMFPISDVKNRVVAFGGRVLGDGQPKYLNSPETELFKKSEILYNENNARALAIKTGKIVVAEGYMDVITLDEAGIRTAVAPMGTAVTERHLQMLWRIAKEPVMCLDGDTAGKRAMDRAAHLCLPLLEGGNTLKFAMLPEGLDPDDLIKQNGGEEMKKILRSAKPLSDALWENEVGKYNVKTPEGMAELENRFNFLTNQIKNTTVSKYYNDYFKSRLWQFSKKKYTKQKNASITNLSGAIPADFNLHSINGAETMLILLVLQHPELLNHPEVRKEFDNENLHFSSDKLDRIRSAILELCHLNDVITAEDLRSSLVKTEFNTDIEYIEAWSKGFFIEKNLTIEKNLAAWRYYSSLHQLLSLKHECSIKENEMTAESEKIVAEFRKAISQMERKVRNMEVAFGDE